jgi:hypothetical protein|tara:strand:- start:117 stop:764 length:648 start_codon:yes stop_codon:yes gene_type:complete
MAHQVGQGVKEGWEWLTPSGSTKWFSSDPSEAAKSRSAARSGLEALSAYEGGVQSRQGDIGAYYDTQQDLTEQEFALRRGGIGLQQERLGLQRGALGRQESSALNQFLGDAYSFRQSGDVQKATGGLYSGEQERGVERQSATMGNMMRAQQEGFASQSQALDISSQELQNQLAGMDIAQARSISDLLKSRGVEMSGIEDLLYQIETERIAYEGAT